MSINATSSVSSVQDMAQALLKNFDTDHDGRLSADEFTAMLGKLLSGTANSTASTSTSTSASTFKFPDPTLPTSYTLGIGFVPSKLNDPTFYSEKYSHALKDQFLPAMQGLPPTSASLQTIVDRINANGGHATLTGKDTIDFADGNGPIDCIVDVGGENAQWGFQNTTGNELWMKRNAVAVAQTTTETVVAATSVHAVGGGGGATGSLASQSSLTPAGVVDSHESPPTASQKV